VRGAKYREFLKYTQGIWVLFTHTHMCGLLQLCVCLHVLNLGEQERAWITGDKHHGLGNAGHGCEVYEECEV
jgi:hypothetical protein